MLQLWQANEYAHNIERCTRVCNYACVITQGTHKQILILVSIFIRASVNHELYAISTQTVMKVHSIRFSSPPYNNSFPNCSLKSRDKNGGNDYARLSISEVRCSSGSRRFSILKYSLIWPQSYRWNRTKWNTRMREGIKIADIRYFAFSALISCTRTWCHWLVIDTPAITYTSEVYYVKYRGEGVWL